MESITISLIIVHNSIFRNTLTTFLLSNARLNEFSHTNPAQVLALE